MPSMAKSINKFIDGRKKVIRQQTTDHEIFYCIIKVIRFGVIL